MTTTTPAQVLLVDDNVMLHQVVHTLLADQCSVTAVATAQDALTHCGTQHPDLILLDLDLPDISGLPLLQRLKHDYPATPVMMLTGNQTAESAIEAIKNGAHDYITKPFNPEELRRKVISALHEQTRLRHPTALFIDNFNPIDPLLVSSLQDYCTVVTAHDTDTGINLFYSTHPQLILLNPDVPGPSGQTLLEWFRRESPETPLIVITENQSADTAVKALKNGVVDYFTTPVNYDHLQRTVARLFHRDVVQKQDLADSTDAFILRIRTTDMMVTDTNRATKDTFGPLCGQVCHQGLLQAQTRCTFCRAHEAVMLQTKTEVDTQLPNGQWVRITWAPDRDPASKHVTETIFDITNDKLREQTWHQERVDLSDNSTTDPLTQILNRRGWTEIAERIAARAVHDHTPIEIIVVDVDHFKNVNDTYGHAIGDQALCHIAELISSTLRPTDVFGRFGGEEFVIILNPTSEQVDVTAERLRATLADTPLVLADGRQVKLTASFGVASDYVVEPVGPAIQTLIERADRGVYQAKHTGRNKVCVGSET